MNEKRRTFTFIWKIKNFSFSLNSSKCFRSPVFYVHELYRSKWMLELHPKSSFFSNCVVCWLGWEHSDMNELELDYELSFLSADESVIHSEIFLRKSYHSIYDMHSTLKAKIDEVFFHKKHIFLPDDTLTVRCRMWKSLGFFSDSSRCSVDTQIITQCKSCIVDIEKFSSLKTNSEYKIKLKPSEKEFQLHAQVSSVNLYIVDDDKLSITIIPCDYKSKSVYKFKVFILDVYGNKVKSSDGKIYDSPPFCIPLIFSRKRLIENKELYLKNDVLTLECKIDFCTLCASIAVYEPEKIDDMVYEYHCRDNQEVTSNKVSANSFSEEHHTESVTTLKDDMISLFREGILSDTKLKTATEIFPAHTAVLSARSSVFKSMFETDMREKINHCVDIEDLNADTVRRLLLFIYSDTLDELDNESAKCLYIAAEKYNIVSLRLKCSNFLKQNILHSSCCDILLLADRHNDKDLKSSVQDCIAENDEAVFFSDEWKNLVETEPRLTTETLLAVYMKNRRT